MSRQDWSLRRELKHFCIADGDTISALTKRNTNKHVAAAA